MKGILSNSFTLYLQEFRKIILLSLITYFPLLLIHAIIVNYIYEISRFTEYSGVAGDIANGVLMLVFLTIAQVPFIKFTLLDMDGEEILFKKSISFTLDKLIPLYIFSCLYALSIFLGSIFFVVPGIIVLFLFYFVPFYISDNITNFRSAIKKSAFFIKKNLIKGITIIILLTILQLFFENLLFILLSFYTNKYFLLLLLKIILLMFLLPLQTIIMTNAYRKWNPE